MSDRRGPSTAQIFTFARVNVDTLVLRAATERWKRNNYICGINVRLLVNAAICSARMYIRPVIKSTADNWPSIKSLCATVNRR